MNLSRFFRPLVLGGYLFVATGLAIQIWLLRQEPHRFLVGPVALFVSFLLIGSAWWVVRGHEKVRTYGHEKSAPVATRSPQLWPSDVLTPR